MSLALPVSTAEEPTVITLWDGVAPGSESFTGEEKVEQRDEGGLANAWITGVSQPTLTVVAPPEEERNGTAVIICPGGGYGGLSWDKEGREVGQWLADMGVTAFVLKYRHGGGEHQHPVPLSDIQRAVRLVRSQADEWKILPERVGVLGFSAGGHLASSVGTHFDEGKKDASDAVEQQSSRPDFLVLIYPVISMDAAITHAGSLKNLLGDNPDPEQVKLMSNNLAVTDKTPPTFIVHAADDSAVPVANALRFYQPVSITRCRPSCTCSRKGATVSACGVTESLSRSGRACCSTGSRTGGWWSNYTEQQSCPANCIDAKRHAIKGTNTVVRIV